MLVSPHDKSKGEPAGTALEVLRSDGSVRLMLLCFPLGLAVRRSACGLQGDCSRMEI